MPDEIQKGQDIEVKENQVDMPATEQPAEAKAEEEKEAQLPEDVKDRTRQEFEKLKERNKQLAEKLAQHEMQQTNSLIDNLTKGTQQQIAQSNLPQEKVQDIVKDLTDENGYINEALLKETLFKASSTANQAVQAAKMAQEQARKAEERISQYEQGEQTRRAYLDFPQANPDSDDYDPKFMELVRNEMIGQAMNRIKPNFYDACKKWSSLTKPAPQPDKETVTEKVQINAGGSQKVAQSRDNLVQGTIKGDHKSIAARLAASGY